jgi:CBS domain-containing protein
MRTVREIMQSNVVTVAPDTSIRELARILEDAGISGAPVCTGNGAIIGVVSATDLVRLAAEDGDDVVADELEEDVEPLDDENETSSWTYFLQEEPPPRFLDVESRHGPNLDEWMVRDIMTPAAHHVSPDTSLPELARMLLKNRIHRALVVEDDRLTGIVSTLDVLRAVAENGRRSSARKS